MAGETLTGRNAVFQYFETGEQDISVRREVVAGVTTFLTMAYIIVLNPLILSEAVAIPGYSQGQVIQMLAITTILPAAVATFVMAVYANRPFALAPGMGANAFLAYTVVGAMGIPWQTAFAAVFVEGLLFITITAVGARRYVIELFPEQVKRAIGAGIGTFLLFLGLQDMHVVESAEGTLVQMAAVPGDPVALLAVAGLFLTFILYTRGVVGSIVIGILATAVAAWALTLGGVVDPGVLTPQGIGGVQYDITPLVGAFVGGFAQIEIAPFLLVVFVLFFSDFLGTAGTLLGVSQIAGFLDEEGNLPDIDRPLMADAIGTTIGGALGTSTVTTYIESAAGVEEGGRTGLTAAVVGVLFLLALVLVPLIAALPIYAAHIALVIVGLIMLQGVAEVDWTDPTWSIPSGLTILLMPLTMNPAYGLLAGIISYPVVATAARDGAPVRPGQWVLAGLGVAYFYVELGGVMG